MSPSFVKNLDWMKQQGARVGALTLRENALLSQCTRFEMGGPARILADAATPIALSEISRMVRETNMPNTVIGGGSNLVVREAGFPGIVLRYVQKAIVFDGLQVEVSSGANLQDLVDETIAHGLQGLQTMTGIPGWVGGAVYGNAGAYGHSIHERIVSVRYFDGSEFRTLGNAACEFHYRESIFKRRKDWIIVSATLRMDQGDEEELRATATGIRKTRDAKYPPAIKCAGSIFKNLLVKNLPAGLDLPASVVREGKVPSAYFLEQAGAKGLSSGPVRVADYHANLIYNEGGGTAAQVSSLVDELKRRVLEKFGIALEEEVQWV